MNDSERVIGFMDSGLGGLSVLREVRNLLPNENYIYYGDSLHAPYGTKSVREVREFTLHNIDFLISKGAKAVVLACNTATSVAVQNARELFSDIPIIGVEPALKPAVIKHPGGTILIMATMVTLHEDKFKQLMKCYESKATILPLPCPGLMEFVERGELETKELYAYLENKLYPYHLQRLDAIVLGCTHYPFLKKAIQALVGEQTEILDGNLGTARELKRKLEEHQLCSPNLTLGNVQIFNSSGQDALVKRSYQLLGMKMDEAVEQNRIRRNS